MNDRPSVVEKGILAYNETLKELAEFRDIVSSLQMQVERERVRGEALQRENDDLRAHNNILRIDIGKAIADAAEHRAFVAHMRLGIMAFDGRLENKSESVSGVNLIFGNDKEKTEGSEQELPALDQIVAATKRLTGE